MLARSIDVKDGNVYGFNPNPMLGSILVEPLTRRGFPAIKGSSSSKPEQRGPGWFFSKRIRSGCRCQSSRPLRHPGRDDGRQ